MKLPSINRIKAIGAVLLVPMEEIVPNPKQPRKVFEEEELRELADSIAENGILQPLTVRRNDEGSFELIAGERRLRAAKMIGMSKVPCIAVDADENQSTILALLENMQRSDLGCFEEAEGIAMLLDYYGMTQEQAAQKLGKAQSTISNKLRLLKLDPICRQKLSNAGLTERHARALLRLPSALDRNRAVDIIIQKELNVAETDKLIQMMQREPAPPPPRPMRIFKDVRIFVNSLSHTIDAMKKAGVNADTNKTETEEYVEYVIRIPKYSA